MSITNVLVSCLNLELIGMVVSCINKMVSGVGCAFISCLASIILGLHKKAWQYTESLHFVTDQNPMRLWCIASSKVR